MPIVITEPTYRQEYQHENLILLLLHFGTCPRNGYLSHGRTIDGTVPVFVASRSEDSLGKTVGLQVPHSTRTRDVGILPSTNSVRR